MLAIRNVLVARDFSAVSTRALAYALGLAARTGAALHVLHAEVPYPAETTPTEGIDHVREALHRADVASVEALRSVQVEGTVRRDVAAAPAILQYAADEDVDLIVLGTHGRRGPSRIRLGSVAAEVVRHADRPVLTVWGEEEGESGGEAPPSPPDRILTPVDFSEYAWEAARVAMEWAGLYDAQVDLLHVVGVTLPPALPFYIGRDDSIYEEQSDLEEKARAKMEAFVEKERGPTAETHCHVWSGKPSTAIIDFAEENAVDLVSIATHGRTGLKRFLLGSVAEKVIRHVRCPVLTVRAFGKSLLASDENEAPDAEA